LSKHHIAKDSSFFFLQLTLKAGANDAQKTAGIIVAVLAASGYESPEASSIEQCVA
jgi:phosphate/sulfate permease